MRLAETQILSTRKQHHCEGCCKPIYKWCNAVKYVGVEGGSAYSLYYHPECREAEIAFNVIMQSRDDEWIPLHEIESDSLPWLEEEHFDAYQRLKGLS